MNTGRFIREILSRRIISFIKTTVCLQVVLLTREEINRLVEIGPEAFSYYLYPDEGKSHFLSQRKRTEEF